MRGLPVNRHPPQQSAAHKLLITTAQYHGRTVAAHRVLLKFKSPPSRAELAALQSETQAAYLRPIGGAGWYELYSSTVGVGVLLDTVSLESNVINAEPDYVGSNLMAEPSGRPELMRMTPGAPNDQFFPQQWAFQNTGQCYGTFCGIAGDDINALQAWSIEPSGGSKSVVIVIYGTGIDYNNPDLAANVWMAPEPYTINEGGNVYDCPQDAHGFNAIEGESGCTYEVYDNDTITPGHGTIVAGVADAISNNGIGVAGTAGGVTLLPISICVGGEYNTCDSATAIRGIDASLQIAQQFGLHLVAGNMSHGNLGGSAMEDEMALASSETGIIFVASTGDECYGSPDQPASFGLPEEIAVGASNEQNQVAHWPGGGCSNAGGDIAAPGDDVLTTRRGDTTGNNPILEAGTSVSAPFVTGAIGLLASACPLTPPALITTLEQTADQIATLAPTATDGRLLNLGAALASCTQGTSATDAVTIYSGGTARRGGPTDYGYISISVGGQTCGTSYDTTYDTAATIAQNLVGDCLQSSYFTPSYQGGSNLLLTTKAIGPYTNYPVLGQVVDQCTGDNCGSAPEIAIDSQFSGGQS